MKTKGPFDYDYYFSHKGLDRILMKKTTPIKKPIPQRKPEKFMSEKELIKKMETKIIEKYDKLNPQPKTLEEKVKQKLGKDYKNSDKFAIN